MHPMILAIEGCAQSACVLSSDLRILHISKGWTAFAQRNGGAASLGGWPIGSHIDDAMPQVLRAYYHRAYDRVLATGERWEHDYECSSPTEYRKFRMCVYPIEGARLAIVHSLVVEVPHEGAHHADGGLYAVGGVVTMCSHCRRTHNPLVDRWEWVSAFVEALPSNASHGLCPACFEFYYPESEAS